MGTLITLHDGLSRTILFFTLICALWGFWRYLRGEGVRCLLYTSPSPRDS